MGPLPACQYQYLDRVASYSGPPTPIMAAVKALFV
jgi:hypothetical protein